MGKYLIISFVFLLDIKVLADPSGIINSINKQHTFNFITIDEGLSNNLVTTICKDAYGYIWFGTFNGVNKYDGYSISSYFYIEDDSTSLIRNTVFSLFLDSKDRFWIGTNGGLCYYNYNKDNFVRKPIIRDNKDIDALVDAICEDKNGIMWLGTSTGLISMNVETLELEYFPIIDAEKPPQIRIISLLLESDSIMNIGTRNNGYFRYNIQNNSCKQYTNIPGDETTISENSIETIYKDLEGIIWIGTSNNGLNRYNRETDSFTRILIDKTNERSKRVRSIIQDEQGSFWFGTKNGLYTKSAKSENKFIHYAHTDHLISTLNNNSIYDIYIDNSGIMWMGTYSGGVNYTNLNKKSIYHFRYKPKNSSFLNSKIVQCFAEDKKGNLWIGTESGGLNVLNKKTGRYRYYTATGQENSLSANNIKCLAFDDNNGLWIGTYQGGLDYLDLDNNKFSHFKYQEDNENSISDNAVYSLLYDSNNNIWVGTYKGLCLINGSNKKIKRFSVKRDFLNNMNFDFSPNLTVDAIFEDNVGNIYVGMISFGLFQFQKADSSFKKINIQGYFSVQTIFQDSKNNLWMGTNVGLFLIDDFTNSVYTKFNTQNGLPSDCIYGILEDEDNNLWISTSAGLVKFNNAVNNPRSVDFVIFDRADGLQSNQFFHGAALKSEDNQMFFGGINGFNSFYPDSLKNNDYIPPVYINEFLIFNKPIPVGGPDSPLQNTIEQTNKIELSWKQSVISFGFIAINYYNPEKNFYAYKMEGFDKDWNYTDASRRLATYTNLIPGTYIFHVKASNNDGIWNEKGTSIKIIMTPPYWKTWWFRGIVIFFLILIVITAFWLRIKNLVNRNKEFEQLVAKRTSQLKLANKELEAFAYSVSHDLRAPLRSIDGFSQILLEEHKNKLDAQGQVFLNKVCNGAQRMSQLIDDILKLSKITRSEMNIKKVNLSSIAKEIANNFQNSETGRNIEFNIKENILVNADERLMQIALENLLGNAWKFTSKKPIACIEFGMMKKEGSNNYFIRDNGAGFDMKYADKLFGSFQRLHSTVDYSGTGIGLATVQRIIHRHGGKVWAEGEVEKGATFYFTLA